ncbi:MAG: NAD/NADP octopine/nopaline dehydrogenase family protein [Micromonosporaceae bacterium]|jgi:opine dehydrogenase
MSTVAVLGAGNGGLAATVELSQAGHDVVLWNRRPATVEPYRDGIRYRGVLGEGTVRPALVTTDLAAALERAEVAVACLPGMAQAALFADLAALAARDPAGPLARLPLVLNPGHTGAALHARRVWREHGASLPPLCELSTLTYVARVDTDHTLGVTGRAGTVRAACLPGGQEALDWAQRLFPGVTPVGDVLASSLSNVNIVLHPPGAVLGLAWVEATGGDFTFYVEGMTPAVARVLVALDEERRAVARAFGHDLPPLVEEMAAIGTVEPADAGGDVAAAIRGGRANRAIRAPDSTTHRYYREDLGYGLAPLVALAEIADRPVPVASALLTLGRIATGDTEPVMDRQRLGLAGVSRADLLAIVRG